MTGICSTSLTTELAKLANTKKAKILQGFFKTKKGEYGEGDIFLGVIVPKQRELAKKYIELSLPEIKKVLHSKIHEERLTALIVLTYKYEKTKNESEKKEIYDFYLKNTKYINNWDLVDISTPKIIGSYLLEHQNERKILNSLSKSKNMWERRISILATFPLLKNKEYSEVLKLSKLFLKDKHDLMHKATGWMLREMGKKDIGILKKFLNEHKKEMPRTMLRYAIEKFPEKIRKHYLNTSK
jgi:3-methyladenine DNA glycosylase AlkD